MQYHADISKYPIKDRKKACLVNTQYTHCACLSAFENCVPLEDYSKNANVFCIHPKAFKIVSYSILNHFLFQNNYIHCF